jgi:hypothetical protein
MLKWAQRLLSRQSRAMLIIDEAEDLIPQGFEMRGDADESKVALSFPRAARLGIHAHRCALCTAQRERSQHYRHHKISLELSAP